MSSATATRPDAPFRATEGDESPHTTRKRLIILAALLLVLATGGLVAKTLLAPPNAPGPDPNTVPGAVLSLESITLNLADGRYLKLTLALQLSKGAVPGSGSGNAATGTASTVDGAKALDAAIGVFGQRTYAQLLVPGGRETAQESLSTVVRKRYDGKVLQVYFKEFLMQ